MQLRKNEIETLDRKYRLNLINSITGIKPANLIGTRSKDGRNNLGIFSSIVHLGSDPAQIGFVMRPQTHELKDTYSNIKETAVYTINHVSESFIKKAHYTSAKLDKNTSEFETMNLEPQFISDFFAPFVERSKTKIGMKFLKDMVLPNGCILIIGEIELIDIPDKVVNKKGQIDLCGYDAVGISGLNTYYSLHQIETFPYVRVDEIPDFSG